MSGRGQERVFELLPFVSLLCNCFPSDCDCVCIFLAGVIPVGVFEILFPSPACKSCWVYTSPLVSVHFPVLLFLTPPAEVTTVQYFRHRFFSAEMNLRAHESDFLCPGDCVLTDFQICFRRMRGARPKCVVQASFQACIFDHELQVFFA